MIDTSRMQQAVFSAYTNSRVFGLILATYILLSGLVLALNTRRIETRPALGFDEGRIYSSWKQAAVNPYPVTAMALICAGEHDVEANDLIAALRPGSPLQIPGGLYNLKHLMISGDVTGAQMTKILEYQQLDSLTLYSVNSLTPKGWEAISRQPLQSLRIQASGDQIWEGARLPATLETMVVRSVSTILPPAGKTRLKALLGLDRLRVLELELRQDETDGISHEDREVLKSLPALHTLYLGRLNEGIPRFLPEAFVVRVQSELPRVRVRPQFYQSNRLFNVLGLNIFGMLPLIVILHTLSLQFASPAAWLTPQFLRPHFQVAGSLLTVVVVIQTAFLLGARCSLLAAVSLALSNAICGSVPLLAFGQRRQFPGYVNLGTAGIPLIFQMGIATLVGLWAPAEADWFFEGHRADLATMLLVASLVGIFATVRILVRLSRILAEQYPSTMPFDIWNPQHFSQWYLEGQSSKSQDFYWRIYSLAPTRRLQRIALTSRNTPGRQAVLWRASQPMTALSFIILWGTYMTVFTSLGSLFSGSIGTTSWMMLPMCLMQFGGACLIAPFIVLFSQRGFYARHLLMSIGRRAWVRLMFREAAIDFIPAAMMSLVGLIALSFWHPADIWPTWQVAILAAGGLTLVYALQMILVTFPTWVTIVGGSVAVTSPFLVVALIVPSSMDEAAKLSQSDSMLYWPSTWWCIVIGLALVTLRFAYYRWMTWELGKAAL